MRAGRRSVLPSTTLGARLGATLILALLPLGVLSVVQSQRAQTEIDRSALEGVAGASLAAVQDQIDLIRDAKITARVLAAGLSAAQDDDTACVDRIAAVAQGIPEATLVAFIPMSGLMTCSSTGDVHDFSNSPLFQKMIATPEPRVVYNPMGPVSGTAVIGIGHPVVDRAGQQLGIVAISLPYFSVSPRSYIDPVALWTPKYLATVSQDGTILISSETTETRRETLPDGLTVEEAIAQAGEPVFLPGGAPRSILAVTAIADDLYLVAIWTVSEGGLLSPSSAIAPFLIPVLTWFAALIVAAFASSQLVVRHVRTLSAAMSGFMKNGTQTTLADLSAAPLEIQSLHVVYQELIRTIEQDKAELENLILDKDTLLREVHHRSGNSLQMISSIMRMYRRETTDPELGTVLDGLINRVIALSSTHTSLYSMGGRRDVPMDEILASVVHRLTQIHGIALGVARTRFDPIRMPTEAAVPLALALAETIGCHLRSPDAAVEGVEISLLEMGDAVTLTTAGPIVPEFLPDPPGGTAALPRRMLQQFARQLRGQVEFQIDENRSLVRMTFPHFA